MLSNRIRATNGFGREARLLRDKDKKAINIFTGEKIRFYREGAGYSREAFAELVGVSTRFIADVETGFVGVSLTNLKRICEILGISADRLLWDQDNQLGLDERVAHIDSKYVDIVEQVVSKQLEVIAIASKEERRKTTRN